MTGLKKIPAAGAMASSFMLYGCERAPSVDILGSFFPVWIFCIAAAIVLTVLARLLLIRLRLDGEMGPSAVIYPGLVVLFACGLWLLFFSY